MVVKTTRITIETESLLVMHRGRSFVAWCPGCCAEVETMTLKGDGLGENLPSGLLTDWLATGKLHLWSPSGGPAQICVTSLLRCFATEDACRLSDPKRTVQEEGEGK